MSIKVNLKMLELTKLNNKNVNINLTNEIIKRKKNTYYSKIIMDNQEQKNNSKFYNNITTNKKWYMHFF